MRLTAFTLALVALFFAGVAPAQETDVERRKADVDTAYSAAIADYNATTAAYIAALEPRYVPVAVPVAVPVIQAAPAPEVEERMTFSLGYLDDGGCNVSAKTLVGSYAREADESDVFAQVRTGPSGGDCERNATSFGLSVERRYAIADGWDAVAKFQADRRSTSAPYAIVDADGMVVARPDGAPSDPVTLPAGAADTIGGILGISRAFGGLRVVIAGNVVPVTWAAHDDSFAAHFAIAWDVGNTFDFRAHADVGRDWYGATRASWRPPTSGRFGVEISSGFAWGLNAVDGGEPAMQTFAGLPVALQGAPRDTALTADVGITF